MKAGILVMLAFAAPVCRANDPFAAPRPTRVSPAPALPAAFTPITHGVSTASPGAADGFYVDWVSPLQPPRDPTATDLAPADSAFRDGDSLKAFSADASQPATPLAIPEPATLALMGMAMLPLAGFLRRRR